MVAEVALLLSLSVALPPQSPVCSDSLRRAAERAAARYEALSRRHAPARYGSAGSGECDELIGRFCFRFTGRETDPADTVPEHAQVVSARAAVIQAADTWLKASPASSHAAALLVRYLIEDGRAEEAVGPARTHARAAGATPRSLDYLGLALLEAGSAAEAEAVLDRARSARPERERHRLDDVAVLLEPAERRRYRRLTPGGRRVYEERFWRLADPSLIAPGNERRAAHYARWVWAGILAASPRPPGELTWGADSEEVLLRYGLPTHRERLRGSSPTLVPSRGMLSSYDPRARPFAPAALLTDGLPSTPRPGTPMPLERERVTAAYVPVSLPRVRPIETIVTRFPTRRGAVLKVDGWLRPDEDTPVPEAPTALLALLDTLGRPVIRNEVEIQRTDSGLHLTGSAAVPAGDWIYRLEVIDPSNGQLALAQYAIVIPTAAGLRLSDPIIAALPAPVLRPTPADDPVPAPVLEDLRPSLAVVPGERAVVWVEATGLDRRGGEARYEVEWWVERTEARSPVGRAIRWLGRRIGVLGPEGPVRVAWSEASTEDPVPLTMSLDLGALTPGLWRLRVRLSDLLSDRTATTARTFRVSDRPGPLVPLRRDGGPPGAP